MSDPSIPYKNGLSNLLMRLEEYASQDYADRIARGESPNEINCTEMAYGFDDMAFTFGPEGAKYLSLSPTIVEKLVRFEKASTTSSTTAAILKKIGVSSSRSTRRFATRRLHLHIRPTGLAGDRTATS